MFIQLRRCFNYLLLVCALCSANECEWTNRALHCNDVDYSSIISMSGRNFTSAYIDKCNLHKWGKSNAFPFSSSLTKLKLSCDIREVTKECLEPLEKLQELDLSGNSLTSLPTGIFQAGNRLRSLNLHGNKVKFLRSHEHLFNNLDELEDLDLSENRINYVVEIFNPLENLKRLNLSGNNLELLTAASFDFAKTKSLKDLDLSYNYLGEIKRDTFAYDFQIPVIDIRQKRAVAEDKYPLQNLNLQNNVLSIIPTELFVNLKNLQILNVRHNRLSYIYPNNFQHLPHLKQLLLGGNQLETLPDHIFDPLIHLQILDLSDMKLQRLQSDLFSKNVNLKRLDISYNKIKTLDAPLFQPLVNMVYLNMSHNQLETFPKRLFESDSSEHTLKIVDFSYNKVNNIQTDIFNMESLLEVHARGNHLKSLDADVFASCTFPLLYIDVRDNRLVYIDHEFFEWLPNLERFEMTGNPWECKCFDNLLQFLSKRRITYTKTRYFDGQESTCIALNQFECKVDEKHYDKYYELYEQANRAK